MAIIFGLQLKRFVDSTPSIDHEADLLVFKRVVARQMYAALAQMVILAAPLLLFFYGWMTEQLDRGDLLYLFVPAVILLVVGLLFKLVEKPAKTMPVAEELQAAYDRVVEIWMKKPFPDW